MRRARLLLCGAGMCMLAIDAAAASAIAVMQARAFATAPGAPTALVVLSLHNTGATADRLLGARTPLAGKVEIHGSSMSDGVMRMRALSALDVPVGGMVELRSGGNHLMLIGLAQPLTAGMVVPLTLTFALAGNVSVNVPVLPMTAQRGVD
jgi:copper(I)-binding protein